MAVLFAAQEQTQLAARGEISEADALARMAATALAAGTHPACPPHDRDELLQHAIDWAQARALVMAAAAAVPDSPATLTPPQP
jgi:hypothetical protein